MARRRFEVYQDGEGMWWWRLFGGNGKVTEESERGYKQRSYVMRIGAEKFPGARAVVV